MATKDSARCLGRNDIGTLAIGMQADLALFKLDETRFSGAGDPLAALVLCGADAADCVMVGGQWKVKNKTLLGIDLETLKHKHSQLAHTLQQSVNFQ